MQALVRICTGDTPELYYAEWEEPTDPPPHHCDELVSELRSLPDMGWVRKNYGEPCLDIAVNRPSRFTDIVARFNEHGYKLIGPIGEPPDIVSDLSDEEIEKYGI